MGRVLAAACDPVALALLERIADALRLANMLLSGIFALLIGLCLGAAMGRVGRHHEGE